MARELGSTADQRELSPLLVAGHTYRECMRLLGWPYGRVSEAARAIKGVESDSRDGRRRRIGFIDARARTNAALRAQLEAYLERLAR